MSDITKRFYFNLTNKCNVSCDFCCMSSGPNKNTFLNFNRFKEILDESDDFFELQLEGGEPFLHPNFYLFLEYANYSGRCKKIIISTNGKLLNKNIQRLTDFFSYVNVDTISKRNDLFGLAQYDEDGCGSMEFFDQYLSISEEVTWPRRRKNIRLFCYCNFSLKLFSNFQIWGFSN